MKLKYLVQALAFSGAAVAAQAAFAQQIVKVDGSSTVFPVTEAVAEEFQKAKKNAIKVTVGISGTGGGFKKFCRGETDISNASRPILKKEMDDCKAAGIEYIELPVAFDALTVVINPKNTLHQAADRRRAEEDVGAGGAGQGHDLEPGQSGLAERSRSSSSAPARIRAPSTTSPRRSSASPSPRAATSPRRKTTTCWCRACRAT